MAALFVTPHELKNEGGHGGPPLQLMQVGYLSVTGLEAEPPRLLRTVMFSGFVGQDSEALKRPLPLFFSVPTRAPVEVT